MCARNHAPPPDFISSSGGNWVYCPGPEASPNEKVPRLLCINYDLVSHLVALVNTQTHVCVCVFIYLNAWYISRNMKTLPHCLITNCVHLCINDIWTFSFNTYLSITSVADDCGRIFWFRQYTSLLLVYNYGLISVLDCSK